MLPGAVLPADLNDILKGDYIPSSLNFANYINAFQTQPLLHYMLNSAIVGVLSTVLQILFALLAAYAIVFIEFKAKKIIFLVMMATMMIPGEVLVITNFQTMRSWDFLNTYQGLILPGLASTFGIFLFRQNMMQIPLELKEASTVAGVSEFGFFWKIVAPMVMNTVVTLAIYFFLVSWNSYMWPLLSTTEDTVRTVEELEITENGPEITLRIAGSGFLYNMVRIIAGTLIRVGRGFYTPERVREILEARERTEAGVTAPPEGLVLVEVCYGEPDLL